jgi:hypothetical protein
MRPNLIVLLPNSMEKVITRRAKSTRPPPSSTPSRRVSRASKLIPRVSSRSRRDVGSPPRVGLTPSDCRQSGTSIMSSHMPPVPPANRSKEPGSDPKTSTDTSIKQDEKHHNAAEEGDTANIEQNKTNKGFFRGRREGWSVYAANGCPARSAAGPCARSSSTRSRRRMLDCGGPRTLTPSSTVEPICVRPALAGRSQHHCSRVAIFRQTWFERSPAAALNRRSAAQAVRRG